MNKFFFSVVGGGPMNSPNESVVQVTDLVRMFSDRAVIDHLSFEIQRGETLVLMGGSGCGKSTLLRHIIGVMKPPPAP